MGIIIFSQDSFGADKEHGHQLTPSKKIILCLCELRACFNEHQFDFTSIDEEKPIYKQIAILPDSLRNQESLPIISVDEFFELYDNVEYISRGGTASVFSAVIQQDRPGVKRGAKIALKMEKVSETDALAAYFFTEKVAHVTPYYPKIYGAYRSPITENLIRNFKDVKFDDQDLNFVIEMELVDTTFRHKFNQPHDNELAIANVIPDSVIFESFIGNWALSFYGNAKIGDAQPENLGLQLTTGYYRCYEINDEFYVIENLMMPVRIDISVLYLGKTLKIPFQMHPLRASSECGKAFLIEYTNSGKDYISSINLLLKHFAVFKKDKEYLEKISLSNKVVRFKIKF